MPGANVQVTYNPNATPAWTFNPDSATVNASGNIVFTSAPNSSWKFTGFSATGGGSIFGPPSINSNGNQMTVSDSCPAANGKQSFKYQVSVQPTGSQTSVWSPDPEIVNDPSSPVPEPAPKPPK
jgi:hypothetical protein